MATSKKPPCLHDPQPCTLSKLELHQRKLSRQTSGENNPPLETISFNVRAPSKFSNLHIVNAIMHVGMKDRSWRQFGSSLMWLHGKSGRWRWPLYFGTRGVTRTPLSDGNKTETVQSKARNEKKKKREKRRSKTHSRQMEKQNGILGLSPWTAIPWTAVSRLTRMFGRRGPRLLIDEEEEGDRNEGGGKRRERGGRGGRRREMRQNVLAHVGKQVHMSAMNAVKYCGEHVQQRQSSHPLRVADVRVFKTGDKLSDPNHKRQVRV